MIQMKYCICTYTREISFCVLFNYYQGESKITSPCYYADKMCGNYYMWMVHVPQFSSIFHSNKIKEKDDMSLSCFYMYLNVNIWLRSALLREKRERGKKNTSLSVLMVHIYKPLTLIQYEDCWRRRKTVIVISYWIFCFFISCQHI